MNDEIFAQIISILELSMDSIDRIATIMPKLLFGYLYIATGRYVDSELATPDKILKALCKA